jgi:hypothetical protein
MRADILEAVVLAALALVAEHERAVAAIDKAVVEGGADSLSFRSSLRVLAPSWDEIRTVRDYCILPTQGTIA